jgi:serine/threonine protein kinase
MNVFKKIKLANYVFISEVIGDSLDEVIDAKLSENTKFKEEDVIRILFQLIKAVNYLEKNCCLLRFIDPKRISVTEDNLKIKNYIVDLLFQAEETKFIK